MSTQNKKQNRALYVCLVLLLIIASIFVAIASGAGKKAAADKSLLREAEMGDITDNSPDERSGSRPTHTPDTDESENGDESASESASVPTLVSIDDIKFSLPLDGSVIVPCSVTSPIYSLTMNDFRTHGGVDIKAEVGTPVCACAAGEISEITEDPMMGTTVKIAHADGIESVYRNLAAELPSGIAVGTAVAAGDTVGAVGDTALIECELEPHLHLELLVNGSPVDPSEYLSLVSADTEYEG